MKVQITQLKAPWPKGATIGSVVEVPGASMKEIPAWAVGKCRPAGEEAEVTHAFPAPGEISVTVAIDSAEVQKLLGEAQAQYEAGVASLRAEHQAEVVQLQGHVADATGALQVAQAEVASLRAELDAAKALAAKAKGAK